MLKGVKDCQNIEMTQCSTEGISTSSAVRLPNIPAISSTGKKQAFGQHYSLVITSRGKVKYLYIELKL